MYWMMLTYELCMPTSVGKFDDGTIDKRVEKLKKMLNIEDTDELKKWKI